MSADNGVYILVSPSKEDSKQLEYRVAYGMAIDNIEYEPDYHGFNKEELKRYFGNCNVFTDDKSARIEAERIHDLYQWTEYGVRTFEMNHPFPR